VARADDLTGLAAAVAADLFDRTVTLRINTRTAYVPADGTRPAAVTALSLPAAADDLAMGGDTPAAVRTYTVRASDLGLSRPARGDSVVDNGVARPVIDVTYAAGGALCLLRCDITVPRRS
jgi:hypothetical protein